MVQRKVAKKGKAKSSSNIKTVTKEKKTLSNGYDKTTLADTAENDVASDSSKQVDPILSKDNSQDNAEEIPKIEDLAVNGDKSRKNRVPSPSKDSAVDNPKKKVAKSKETASTDKGKSRKRKQDTEVIENKPAVTKSKIRKQEVDLRVPSLSSFSGKVFVVGENGAGQLGLNDDVNFTEKPFQLDVLKYPIVDIAAGGMHSVCLTENGEVLTFGCNDEKALGRGTSSDEEYIPKKVEIAEKIVQVSAGDSHTAALAESGQVYLWGNFRCASGPMGLRADGEPCPKPVKVLTNKTIVKISSGADHLACLSNDGSVYTCGCAEQGQLGRINPRACQEGGRVRGRAALLEPGVVFIRRKLQFTDLWTESHGTFMKAKGTESIYACGLTNYNQLGLQNVNGDQENPTVFFPQHVTSFNDKVWHQINGGSHHTLALDSSGLVHALGRHDYGRLGLGDDEEDKPSPTVIPTLQKCSNISCGNTVSYAVTEAGELYSWGMASSQLGHGETANENDHNSPRLIKGTKGELQNSWQVLKVAGGGQHALILACPRKASNKDKKA